MSRLAWPQRVQATWVVCAQECVLVNRPTGGAGHNSYQRPASAFVSQQGEKDGERRGQRGPLGDHSPGQQDGPSQGSVRSVDEELERASGEHTLTLTAKLGESFPPGAGWAGAAPRTVAAIRQRWRCSVSRSAAPTASS